MTDVYSVLEKLTSVNAVSGDESKMLDTVQELLKDLGEFYTDSLGNIFCTFGEGHHIALEAHTDQIGFIVKSVSDDGFIKVDKCGGIDRRMLLASEVIVHGKEDLRGVISTLPPHLQKQGDEKSVPEISDISIDIGMSKEQADKYVSPGDKVSFYATFTKLLGSRVCSGSLDNRSGAAAVILAAQYIKEMNLKGIKVTVMLSSQEELGTRGAKSGLYGKNICQTIAVDVSFGYSPLCKKEDCGELGKGPMIGYSPVLDKKISLSLADTADKLSIPYQREVMGAHTGTDADVISLTQSGIATGLVSIPLKYMHSPCEIIDTEDVINTAKLLAGYVKAKAGEFNA